MGWAGGSRIMTAVINATKDNVDDVETRGRIYAPIHAAMEEADWDTQDECLDIDEAFDLIYYKSMEPHNWMVVESSNFGDDTFEESIHEDGLTLEDATKIAHDLNSKIGKYSLGWYVVHKMGYRLWRGMEDLV